MERTTEADAERRIESLTANLLGDADSFIVNGTSIPTCLNGGDDTDIYTVNATDGSDPQAVHPGGLQFVPGWQPRGTGEGDKQGEDQG